MSLLLAAALWAFHGVALLWNWGRYRPQVALLHGLAVAAAGGALLWLALPVWALYVSGGLIGAVAGWGHPLVPGIWPGLALLVAVPVLLHTTPALLAFGDFAVAVQAVAFLVAFSKSSLK
jgi:hypothetical protein